MQSIIDEFKESIDIIKTFSHLNFEIVKEELISSKSNIIFLLAPPGAGKSFLLNFLAYKFPKEYILFDKPFLSKEDVLKSINVDSIEKIKNKKFLIDEAQLLGEDMLEFFRVLSDKGNQVIFAMHIKEGEEIIKKPQFFSRYSEKIYLNNLNYEEFEKYVSSIFINHNKDYLLNKRMLKKIYKITKGNFRLVKKFFYNALILLNYSLKNNLKYKTLDDCILTMTKIKLGIK